MSDPVKQNPVIVLAAGGTGGHVFPAQALASELMARGVTVHLVTDQRGEPLTTDFPCEHKLVITAASPSGRNPVQLLKVLWGLVRASLATIGFLRKAKASMVVGFGGYPSVPTLWAARFLGLPIVLHEQNAVLGRSNRMFAVKAKWIASGFERLDRLPVAARARHVVVGNPLRPAILRQMNAAFPKADRPLQVLVLGGSLGARILSDTVPAAFALLPEALRGRMKVTAQITKDRADVAEASFSRSGIQAEIAPFFEDVATHLASAHLVVARAGATTIAELAAMGKPSILIPLAIAMDDHQTINAQILKQVGAADLISEEELTPEKLAALVQARLSDMNDLAKRAKLANTVARADAAQKLADLVLEEGN
ncbi:MAG: undecaprenyldiphospho-muramoylpentapeptide beta-N-acetylglucosaminyltransferase [Robiginitomaculum sp.]|nr:MAG: undecaprenyldiphospho-muramoylpentapeptide beta-N-acetylglucosaminyltransferase [Robiginitomaculum sp.]